MSHRGRCPCSGISGLVMRHCSLFLYHVRYYKDLVISMPGQEPHQPLPCCNPQPEPPTSAKSTSLLPKQSSILNSSNSGRSGQQSSSQSGKWPKPQEAKTQQAWCSSYIYPLQLGLKYLIKQLKEICVCVGIWFDGKMAGGRNR